DRSLDEQNVVRRVERPAAGVEEIRDLDPFRDRQQLALGIEQRKLTAVARGELEYGEFGLVGHRRVTVPRIDGDQVRSSSGGLCPPARWTGSRSRMVGT